VSLWFDPACLAADAPWAGLGRAATPQEIAAWDIDVKPDGTGLPPGRGTVAQGQATYDAKCASCHGTFGESNQYLQLAGGVGTLGSDNPVRTTGSKLNYAPTLWDYINRAMPFQAPKSLTADEVYALTAYVLYLNEIVPEDAALDRGSIVRVSLPNRAGFSTRHGFMRVDGEPDVRAQACMRDCPVEGRIASSIPDHARNAHGNLAEQVRGVGPYRGADTAKPEPVGALAAARQARAAAPASSVKHPRSAAELAKQYACLACHGVDQKVVGPGFREVAKKYRGESGARQTLARKVREGGSGVWGAIAMPGQPQVPDADLNAIVEWVLAGAQ
jgi:cytochrome c